MHNYNLIIRVFNRCLAFIGYVHVDIAIVIQIITIKINHFVLGSFPIVCESVLQMQYPSLEIYLLYG